MLKQMFFGLPFDGVEVAAGEKHEGRKKNSARKPKAKIFKNHMRWTINIHTSSLENPLSGEKYA